MKSFTDITGAAWDISVTIGTAIKLKSRLDLDIEKLVTTQPGEESVLDRLATDGILLFRTIWVICEEQARARGLTEDAFAERFTGETIEAATGALLDEFINFSRPAQRQVLTALRRISDQYRQAAEAKLTALISDPKFGEEITSQLPK